jgi:hypothetical protein
LRLDTALDVESQLPAQEEILGAQALGRPETGATPIGRHPRREDSRSSGGRPCAHAATALGYEPGVTARPRAGWNICGAQLRHPVGRGGHHDGIERSGFGPAQVAVADPHVHVRK